MEMNMPAQTSNKKIGPIVGALIIVVLLIVAALFVWGSHLNGTSSESTVQSSASTSTDTVAKDQTAISTSDDTSSIANDLDASAKADAATTN